jgi:hypothetical protein
MRRRARGQIARQHPFNNQQSIGKVDTGHSMCGPVATQITEEKSASVLRALEVGFGEGGLGPPLSRRCGKRQGRGMSVALKTVPLPRDETYFRLCGIAEGFLHEEAELLDARDWGARIEQLSDDLTYFMTMKQNVKAGEHSARESTHEGRDINGFEEDRRSLPSGSSRSWPVLIGWRSHCRGSIIYPADRYSARNRRSDGVGCAQAIYSLPKPGRARGFLFCAETQRYPASRGWVLVFVAPRGGARVERLAGQNMTVFF